MAKVTSLKINNQTNNTNTVYATWKFSKSHLDYYRVYWYYATGDGVWFNAGSSDIKIKQATYSFPANATAVKISVKPVSKKRKVKGKMKSYWTGTYKSKVWYVSRSQPDTPSAPKTSVNKYRVTAYIDLVNNAVNDRVAFQVIKVHKNGKITKYKSTSKPHRAISGGRATYAFDVKPGAVYRVKCRVHNLNNKGKIIESSQWSPYSDEIKTVPGAVTNVKCRASSLSKNTAFVSWNGVADADSYEIQYTNVKAYFNSNPSGLGTATSETTHAEIPGLELGKKYFFRVRSKNTQGESAWRPVFNEIVSVILGTKPQAPTTWTISNVATLGDPVTLYWVHNTEDGSKQVDAQIELRVGDSVNYINYVSEMERLGLTIPTVKEDEEEKTYSLPIYTADRGYHDSDEIKWRIRTKGITNEYSDWSIERSFTVYDAAYLNIVLGNEEDVEGDVLTSYPYSIILESGPTSQTPITYHISILAKESYKTEDEFGVETYVIEGTELYSSIIASSDNVYNLELLPSMVTLEDGREYAVKATVSMNSGLIAEASADFSTEFDDFEFEPEATVDVDMETLSATITPVCYVPIDDEIDEPTERVLSENVTLSVYRKEYDGSFTEIGSDIPNDGMADVLDPHPALDYARYRIIAQSTITGAIEYEDVAPEPVQVPGIVIQWDEEWIDFDTSEDNSDDLETPTWTGNMVKLPYNVKVTEKKSQDNAMVKYAGRSHPVGYYGTHKNEGGSWSAEIDAQDTDTLYLLRQLSNWSGDVYVRESTGVGYWANIVVDISIEGRALTIPVSFNITRVEGGK